MKNILKLAALLSVSIYASGISNVVHVPADQPTIQQGIDLSVNGDTVLVADGIYSGNNNHDITFGGKTIVVKSVNGPDATVLDCQGDQWTPRKGFLFLNEGRMTILDGFTIRNGSTGPYCLEYSGGAIYCEGSPTIKNCRFVDNTNRENNCLYSGGGAMFCFLGSPLLIDCVFENNDSDDFGGAVNSINAAPIFHGCLFLENSAVWGAAVHSDNSNIVFNGCVLGENTGDSGTVYSPGSSRIDVSDCILVNNISAAAGSIKLISGDSLIMANSVLRDISPAEISADSSSGASVSYSDISGGWPGAGNIDCDPVFCDPENYDFSLSAISCCIGSGRNGTNIGGLSVGCGALGGTVINTAGLPIGDVAVILMGSPYQTTTDTTGHYLVPAIAPGNYNVLFSHNQYSDTLVTSFPVALEYDSLDISLSNPGPCENYVVGDINGSGAYNGLDVTFGVTYFKGGPPPSHECQCGQIGVWYASGDVNGSCSYNGLDITYGVSYLKGGDGLAPCPDCAP